MKRPAPTPSPAPRELEKMLRPVDVAETLGVSRRTFERLLASGQFPRHGLRIGRSPLWRPSTVQGWIEAESRRQDGRAA